jgi:3-hydroxyisobutyrate dehydrogenase-like beta-hydroxyacid dehydrogenase
MARIGVLGLGMMGTGIAQNLLSKRHEVHVYNRTQSRMNPLVELGAIPHRTPGELGQRVDIAITMVTDEKAVEDIALGQNGLLEGMKPGSLWIDMSTIDPDASLRHAQECATRGVLRLDAPVMGGPRLAREGALTVLVGGRRDVYEAHQQLIRQLGREVIYLGGDGSGHRMKLALNLYLALKSVIFAEALTFAQKLGFEPGTFVEALNRTHLKSGFTETKGVSVSRGEFSPTFPLRMMMKDILLADEQTKRHGMALLLTGLARQLYSAASMQGLSELDYSAITLLVQRLNGVDRLGRQTGGPREET